MKALFNKLFRKQRRVRTVRKIPGHPLVAVTEEDDTTVEYQTGSIPLIFMEDGKEVRRTEMRSGYDHLLEETVTTERNKK